MTTPPRISLLLAVLGSATLALAIGCDARPPAEPEPAAPKAPNLPSIPDTGAKISYEELLALIAKPDPFEKARELGALLPTLGAEALPAVREVLTHVAVLELSATEFELLMRYWALHEPELASIYAYLHAPRAFKYAAIHATLRPWAAVDPQAALARAAAWSMARGDAGAAAQVAFIRGWHDSGQPGLEEYIRDLGVGFERQRALAVYATSVIQKDGAKALVDWAEAIPEEQEAYRLDVFRKVGAALVPYDIGAAKRFCDAHCEGPSGDSLRSYISDRWVQIDPTPALEWLSTAPEGKETNWTVRVTYASWGAKDPEGAIRWMNETIAENGGDEPPEWLRPTYPIHARLIAQEESPLEGIRWAEKIEDPQEREWVAMNIAREWRDEDETAAEKWMQQSWLSPETLEKIRDPSPTWRRNRNPK